MKKADVFRWSLGLFVLVALFGFNACGDEEPDPQALDREKFIGSYLGELVCPGTLALISADSVDFSIDVGIDPNETQSVIVFLPVEGQPAPLSIKATVSGSNITFADTKESVPIPQFGGILTDIVVSGDGSISGNDIMGDMSMVIFLAGTDSQLGNDDCTITGVKQ